MAQCNHKTLKDVPSICDLYVNRNLKTIFACYLFFFFFFEEFFCMLPSGALHGHTTAI